MHFYLRSCYKQPYFEGTCNEERERERERESKKNSVTVSAGEVVARLLGRESEATSTQNAALAAADALQRISTNLSRFIGNDGCYALFTRARAQAEAAHPSLANIRIMPQPNLSLHGVSESIEASGAAPVAAGLESTLIGVVELLVRLIGEELAMKLVDQSVKNGATPDRTEGWQ